MNKYQATRELKEAERQLKNGNCNKGLVSAKVHALVTQTGLFSEREQKLIIKRLDKACGFKQPNE